MKKGGSEGGGVQGEEKRGPGKWGEKGWVRRRREY